MSICGVQLAKCIFVNIADVQNILKMNIGLRALNTVLSQTVCINRW